MQQQQVNGTLRPQFPRQACKEIQLSNENSSKLQRKLKKLLCGTRPILLHPKVGDSKAVVRHFVSHPDDFNTPHGLHRVMKRRNMLDFEVDVACSNSDKFRGDTTRQYVRLKIKHMVDMLAAEVEGKSHWLKQDINVKDMAFYLVQAAIITSKSSSQISTLSSSHPPPPLAPLRDEFHIPEFLGGLHNLQQLNLWVGIRNTLTSAHYDANHNVLLVLRGEKHVTLAHHSVIPMLQTAHSWEDGANHSFLPTGALLDNEEFASYRMEVTVKSGSALFIPEGSFHEVRSSPGTIAVNMWYCGDRARLEDDLPAFHQAYLFRSLARSLFERAVKKVESRKRRRRGYRGHSERSNLLPNANYMTREEMSRTFTPRMISERRLQWHRVICGASPATASLLISALGESWDAGEAQALWTHLEGLNNKTIAAEKDSSSNNNVDNNMMENGNCNGIVVNGSSQVNDDDVVNANKETDNKQQIADPTIETDSTIKSNANATTRSSPKRKRDRENKVAPRNNYKDNFEQLEISVKQMKKTLKQIVKNYSSKGEPGAELSTTISVRILTKEAAAQLADDECSTTKKQFLRKRLKSVVYSGEVKGIKEIKNKQATLIVAAVKS